MPLTPIYGIYVTMLSSSHKGMLKIDLRMCFFIFITTVTMKEPMVLIKVDYFNKMVTNPLSKRSPFKEWPFSSSSSSFFCHFQSNIFPIQQNDKRKWPPRKHLALVFWRGEKAIHMINLYLVDSAEHFPNTYPLDSYLWVV